MLAIIAMHRETWLERIVQSVPGIGKRAAQVSFARIRDNTPHAVFALETDMGSILETLEFAYGNNWSFELISARCVNGTR